MIIRIDPALQEVLPDFHVIAYTMDVQFKTNDQTTLAIKTIEKKIKEEYSLEDILNIPLIKTARDSYKKLGKDPSRYRLACESLLRRLVKGYGLTPINNIVDAGNLLSIALFRSTCIADAALIKGDVRIRIGTNADQYEGIGRGKINVSRIPLYEDSHSPFGSPTSDTARTSIHANTKTILVMVICFDQEETNKIKEETCLTFQHFAAAGNIQEVQVI
ncbi:MAG: phenylalanine--tRNA ligase beta subunit-related protein [Bacilli bacterium]|jgi:DNA/RNA-binding domain of Phe-tRNA-synthetase-like protein|nr:phenylalanine--tRNA ligase beta subunit-related protein [Bacilli bacterium]